MTKQIIQDMNDDSRIALVVDLDGTLCQTNTLHESLLTLVAKNPLQAFRLPGWLAAGRTNLKANLADRHVLDPALLPLNEMVLEVVRQARSAGRRTALVSAADHRVVTAVAKATGVFDEAYGSAEGMNLKGAAKADFLIHHFGEGMFDYIGDSMADLPVWAAARWAVTVRAGKRLRAAAGQVNPATLHMDPPQGCAASMLRALRTHQWSKNLLLFLPMLAAHEPGRFLQTLPGFLAFCLAASSVYVINDLLDLEADRAHQRKRHRPFASGALTADTGAAMVLVLMTLALVAALAVGNPAFLGLLALYLVATFAYSLWLKRKLIIDTLMLAGLYTVRVVAGAAAADVTLSPWLLAFSMFLFLSLATVKRQTELTDLLASGLTGRGRAYLTDDLPILYGIAISAAQAAVLVLALYISSPDVADLYAQPEILWLICPLLLYWSLRMVMKAHRGEMTDDPIVFAVADRVSLYIILSCLLVVLVAAAGPFGSG